MTNKLYLLLVNGLSCLRIPLFILHITSLCLILGSIFTVLSAVLQPVLASLVYLLAMAINSLACLYALSTRHLNPAHSQIYMLIRYPGTALFFLCLGLSAYQQSDSRLFIYAAFFSGFLWGYFCLLMIRYASRMTGNVPGLLEATSLRGFQQGNHHWWDKALASVWRLQNPVVIATGLILFSTADLPGPFFLASTVILAINIIFLLRLLGKQESPSAKAASRSGVSFLFYMFGILILLVLIARLPLADVLEVIQAVGTEAGWLLLVPVIWVVPYAMALKVLLDNRVTFRDAVYTQISGDAFNSITPLLGLGGEPYKAKHLSNFVSLEDASRAIVQSRLIHALSGVLFAAIVILVTVLVVNLSGIPGLAVGLTSVALLMFSISGLLLWVTMSRAPSRITGLVLKKFRIVEEFRHDRLSWKILWITMLYKIIGRTGKFLELYVIFLVLDIAPTFSDMVLVEAMIMVSISIFFFVPQGLGVNEAGIVTAFTIAGYAAATGVVFGLIRRARMVVYALFGLLVYLLGTTTRFGKSRYLTATGQTEKQSV